MGFKAKLAIPQEPARPPVERYPLVKWNMCTLAVHSLAPGLPRLREHARGVVALTPKVLIV